MILTDRNLPAGGSSRTHEIRSLREQYKNQIQDFLSNDISGSVQTSNPLIQRETGRRRLSRMIASPILSLLSKSHADTVDVPYPFDVITVGERFSTEASQARLLSNIGRVGNLRVLIPGCYLGGDDVQFWLRRGVTRLDGVDVYSLDAHWRKAVPALESAYGAKVVFRQGSIEALPYEDETFDVVATSAVLEHVRNLDAMASETARVLRPGGWAWHSIGPFYTAYGGDHCIAAYGPDAGYDHLLLSEEEYQERIQDQEFFDQGDDPNLPFWALHDQFSFATSEHYLNAFSPHFDVDHVLVKLSEEGLSYKMRNPDMWKRLLKEGYSESDLLVKSLNIVLRARSTQAGDLSLNT